jgi:sec-independent protein translocase protein TatA
MFGLGFGELLLILVIVLLIFGAGKLPQIGDALGRSIKNFKRAASGTNEIDVSKKKEIEASAGSKGALEESDDVEDAEVVRTKKRKADT